MIIDSSIIRDIDSSKVENTLIKAIPGATISDIREDLDSYDEHFNSLTLVCGGNDIDNACSLDLEEEECDDYVDLNEVKNDFSNLIDLAKEKARNVIVSSVIPRYRPSKPQLVGKIDLMNSALQMLCGEKNVSFINNDTNFKLPDETINEGFFYEDREEEGAWIHLNKQGTNRLAKNLELNCTGKDVTRRNVRRKTQQRTQQPYKNTHGHDRNRLGTAEFGNTRKTHNDFGAWNQRKTTVRCWNCSEPGHTQAECRLERPVRCSQCYQIGHKSEFCHD